MALAELAAGPEHVLDAVRAADTEREQRADRAGPGLDRARAGERRQLTTDRFGGLAPRACPGLASGRGLGVHEQVWAAQVTADLGRLRRGERRRAGGKCLEQVLDDVRVRQALDQLGTLEGDRAQMGDRAGDLGVLLAEPAADDGSGAQQPDALATDRHRRDEHIADGELGPQRASGRPVAATLERGEQQRRLGHRLGNRHLPRR